MKADSNPGYAATKRSCLVIGWPDSLFAIRGELLQIQGIGLISSVSYYCSQILSDLPNLASSCQFYWRSFDASWKDSKSSLLSTIIESVSKPQLCIISWLAKQPRESLLRTARTPSSVVETIEYSTQQSHHIAVSYWALIFSNWILQN